MIEYGCPSCGQRIQVGDEHAGKQAKCPKCGVIATIPRPLMPPGQYMQPAMMPHAAGPTMDYKGQAIAALVLGVVSLAMCWLPIVGVICAVIGVIFGILALQKKRTGKGIGIAGLVLSCMGLAAGPVVFVATMGPVLKNIKKQVRTQSCEAQLSAIGKGVVMYSALSSDMYPFPMIKKYGDPNAPVRPGQSTGIDFGRSDWAVLGDNGMQNFWLAIKENLLSPDHFHCPADENWIRKTTGGYGWNDAREFSFGVTWPYDGLNPRSTMNSARLSDSNGNFGLAIVADRNPRTSGNLSPQPSNHPNEGTVVLYRDSHIGYYKNAADFKAGDKGDDIYSNTLGAPGGIPQNGNDTSITPVPAR